MRSTGMNVVVIGPYPQDLNKVVGGVESVNATLAPALAHQYEIERVTVLSFGRDVPAQSRRQISDKLHVWYLRGQRRPILTRSLWELWQTRRAVAELQPDVIHAHGIGSPGDIATQLGKPAVVTVHGLEHVEARLAQQHSRTGRIRARIVESTVQRVLDRAKVIISISDYDARSLDGQIKGTRISIPNPVAPEFFEATQIAAEGNRVMFAGVLRRRKNVEGLVRAFAAARDAASDTRLVILGPAPEPDYQREILDLVDQLGVKDVVDFLGHVENDQLISELRKSRVVALFSHEETSPTILAQAMAIGKPIAASRVGGISEIVRDGENGFLVERADEAAFADKLRTLLASEDLCRTMGERGHAIALGRCEPNAVAQQTIDAYRLAQQSYNA